MTSVVRILRPAFFILLSLCFCAASDAAARRYNRPAPRPTTPAPKRQQTQNTNAAPAAPKAPETVAFKDLPDKADFYLASDSSHYIKYTKLSATAARSNVGPMNRVAQVVPMSATMQVLPADKADVKSASVAK
jgi:hypothetical protein